MAQPTVTVIMPAYNAQDTIQHALYSVLHQTYQDFEVIVVDDCSTDRTIDKVKEIDDSRIRLFRHSENVGPAAARNTALENASGAWATVLDADDAWHQERLEVLVDLALQHGENVFLADDIALCYSDEDNGLMPWKSVFSLRGYHIRSESEYADLLTLIEYNIDIKPFFPLDAVRRFEIWQLEEAFGGEWLYFIAQLFQAGLRLLLVNRPLYYYRISGQHLTDRYDELLGEIWVNNLLLKQDWIGERLRAALRRREERLLLRKPWLALRNRLYMEAIWSFVKNPRSLVFPIRRLPFFLYRRLLGK